MHASITPNREPRLERVQEMTEAGGERRVRVRFLGTGDAFGSGGRNQSSYLIETKRTCFLLDCGPTALLALKRFGIDPARVDSILLSHFHGDHIAGLPFFFLEWLYQTPRGKEVEIAGPAGIQERAETLFSVMYAPGRAEQLRPRLRYTELKPDQSTSLGEIEVFPFRVPHQIDAVSLALKIRISDKTILYSGDSPWTEALAHHSQGADLFICECTHYRAGGADHLSLEELLTHRGELKSRRVILTHLGAEVLSHLHEVPYECATDGMVLEV